MNNLHIENSYNIWNTHKMKFFINKKCYEQYNSHLPEYKLNRSYYSMYIEWWLHNIGYYLTKPLCFFKFINKINLRFKDVDLEELDI